MTFIHMPITIKIFLKRYISRKIQNAKTGNIGLMNMTMTTEKLKYELNVFFPPKKIQGSDNFTKKSTKLSRDK